MRASEEEGVCVTSTASGSARAPPSNDIQTQLLQTLVQQQSQLLQQNSQILQHLTSSKPNPFSIPLQTPASARSETQESQSASRNAKFCNYCKKSGHVKDECFKLQRRREADKGSSFPPPATASASNESSVNLVVSSETDGSFASPPASFTIGGLLSTRTLFDTSSKISILSEEFASRFGCEFLAVKESCTAATNQPMEVLGALTLEFAAADFRIDQRFLVVPEFAFSALLGRDFLRAASAGLSFTDGTVTVGKPPNVVRIQSVQALSEEDGVSDERVDLANSDNRVCAITVTDCSSAIVLPSAADADPCDRPTERPDTQPIPTETPSPPIPETVIEPCLDFTQGFPDVAYQPAADHPTVITLDTADVADALGIEFPISDYLNDAEKQEIRALLYRYVDVFSHFDGDLGRTDAGHHSILTGDNLPVNQPPRRLAPPLLAEAERQIASMLQSGVIRESSSPWASPILFADKKDTSKRFCVDYRLVNLLTVKDRYPLPRIDDSLDLLYGNLYFTRLDLKSGYWQIRVSPEDIMKTAFICPLGLYEFTVMPFGLCNAPSTFQRTMDTVLAGLKWQTCLVYIDDILVFSPTFPIHLDRLEAVLSRLRRHNLKLTAKKCSFGSSELQFLGYVVTPHGLRVDPAKIDAVRKVAPPSTKSLLRSFIGLSSSYRRFIQNFAELAEPLTRLLRDVPFEWTEVQQRAFEEIKRRLTTTPLLTYPNWDDQSRI